VVRSIIDSFGDNKSIVDMIEIFDVLNGIKAKNG